MTNTLANTPGIQLTRAQLEVINRRNIRYPLPVAEKEIRSPIKRENLMANWAVAKEEQERDLGMIYCSQVISNQEIETLIKNMDFEDIV